MGTFNTVAVSGHYLPAIIAEAELDESDAAIELIARSRLKAV
ncbi:hypothetical protein [Mycobacterium sp.]